MPNENAASSSSFRTVCTATLAVRNWARAVDFYKAAFGATELYRVEGGGVVQLSVAGAEFWVAEESPPHLNFSPDSLGGDAAATIRCESGEPCRGRRRHRKSQPPMKA